MIRYCYGKSRKRLYIAHEIQGRSMKKNLMNYLYVLLFVVTAIELNARSYYFKSYEVEDGLSNNNVTCCVQDMALCGLEHGTGSIDLTGTNSIS